LINTSFPFSVSAFAKMRSSRPEDLCIIDARTAGVSGDKYLGALVDLGGSMKTLEKVAKAVETTLPGTRNVTVAARRVERGEIAARLVTVDSEEEAKHRKGLVILNAVKRGAEKLHLSKWGTAFASTTIETLLNAESAVHNQPSSSLELHELGSADTIVDILGVASLAEEIELDEHRWVSTPVAVGGGTSHFSGREYPNPPPAATEILRSRKFAFVRGAADGELTTPTGAAITVNLAEELVDSHQSFSPQKIGYGAGSKEIDGVANILRLMVGTTLGQPHAHDQVVVLETNLDDVTGEIVGHALARIMEAGARDVSVAPVFMKKNRPGYLMSVIADATMAEELANVIMAETGTLGVREIPVSRHITLREERKVMMRVKGKDYHVTVKVALDSKGRRLGEKAEYEDLSRISRETGITVRRLQQFAKPLLRVEGS